MDSCQDYTDDEEDPEISVKTFVEQFQEKGFYLEEVEDRQRLKFFEESDVEEIPPAGIDGR